MIPEETAGPFPGDGSNGPDVLTQSGVVRQRHHGRASARIARSRGRAADDPARLHGSANGCTPLADAAVYLWHCDREGRYSLYSQGVDDENYLRGVQAADATAW